MKTSTLLKRDGLIWLSILAPLVFALLRWNDFPDRIPIHWDVNGDVNSWGGKWAVFLCPALNLAVYFLLLFTPRIDPRKKNYNLFSGSYLLIRTSVAVLLALVGFITLLSALGAQFNVGLIIMNAVLALFVILGNQMGKLRPNFFVGIRTPWTLSSEEVWMKTHRFAGRIWVIASLLMFIPLWIFPMKITALVFIAYLVIIIVFPFVYSGKLHKEIMNEKK